MTNYLVKAPHSGLPVEYYTNKREALKAGRNMANRTFKIVWVKEDDGTNRDTGLSIASMEQGKRTFRY